MDKNRVYRLFTCWRRKRNFRNGTRYDEEPTILFGLFDFMESSIARSKFENDLKNEIFGTPNPKTAGTDC